MKIMNCLREAYSNLYNFLIFKYNRISPPVTLKVNGCIRLMVQRSAVIHFGENVVINSSAHANPSGGYQTTLVVGKKANLMIGNDTGISNSVIVAHESVVIGNNVNIGVNNMIYDTDMHSVEFSYRMERPDQHIHCSPIVIDDGAWICGHCIILKGVHIGKRSVVAAGSVVTRDIPDDELWGGNPCRFIRKLNNEKRD